MNELAITIPVAPIPKGRPRTRVVAGHAHVYPPPETARAEEAIRMLLEARVPAGFLPFTGPLRVTVTAFLQLPKGIPKRDHDTALPSKRPDIDNFAKLILDAADGLWIDDGQIVDLHVHKRYAITAPPHWALKVTAINPQQGETT